MHFARGSSVKLLAVVAKAIPYGNIILIAFVAQVDEHRKLLADLDHLADGADLGVEAALDVHPAVDAAAAGRHRDYVEHVDDEGLEEDLLLLLDARPAARHLPRRVPLALHVLVVLDDQHVLDGIANGARTRAAAPRQRHEERERVPVLADRDVAANRNERNT